MGNKPFSWPPEPHRSSAPAEPDWDGVTQRLDRVVGPLLAAGWAVVKGPIRDRGDADYAASVAYDLRRGDEIIEVEYLDSDVVNLYRGPFVADEDDPSNTATTIDLAETNPVAFFSQQRLLP